jgi:hypothetical protein
MVVAQALTVGVAHHSRTLRVAGPIAAGAILASRKCGALLFLPTGPRELRQYAQHAQRELGREQATKHLVARERYQRSL